MGKGFCQTIDFLTNDVILHSRSRHIYNGVYRYIFSESMVGLISLYIMDPMKIELYTDCGLVTPYGEIELAQHWFR